MARFQLNGNRDPSCKLPSLSPFIKNDDQGSFRLVKKSGDNCARDDAAAALLLAAGGWDRASRKSGTAIPAFESSIVG